MEFKQLFFIEGRLLGEAIRGLKPVHGELHPPTSDLYFCQHCGEVYARCPVIKDDGSTTTWQSYRATCRKCAPAKQRWLSDWPGSIWREWDKDFCNALPPAVLQWELERHIESWERIPQGYQT